MSDAEGGSSESQPGNSRQNVGSCRAKSRKDPPESDQTLVNRAILESLKQIQESICNRNENLPYYEDNGSQATYQPSVKSDSDSHVDIESELNELTNIGNTVRSANDEESSDLLFEYDYQLDIETDKKGPKIDEKVASVVNKLCLKRISQEQSKALIKKHTTPENVNIMLPKCEQSIWNQIPGHTRMNDVKLQGTQSLLLSSINCQLKVSEALLKLKADKETLTSCLDGLTLAMTANYELNQRRRESMKPQFKPEFAKGLCTSTVPANEFLFGGDTAKRVKEISEINKSKMCRAPPHAKDKRYSPYQTRQYRGDFSRRRERAYRGRGSRGSYSSYSGSRSNQYFYNAPQPDKKTGQKSTHNWYVEVDTRDSIALIDNQPPFMAGKTKYHISNWLKITTDPEIIDCIAHCHIEFIDEPCKYSFLGQQHFNTQQKMIITTEVEKLLGLGVIELSAHEHGECLSPIFVTPKSDGSFRLIFNLKNCNKAVLTRHFKMDTLSTAISLITPECFMASLDLKHAYYSIPIAREQQKFLKFLWNGKLYQFIALPMGLTSSPRIFTKIVKPPLAFLRKMGYTFTGYIDDFLLLGKDAVECSESIDETVKLFLDLGFTVHQEKSVLRPTQELTFLGFILNSKTMTVTMSQEKKEKLRALCLEALHTEPLTIRFVARVIGKIVSSLPGVKFGKLQYRNLERDKNKYLALHCGNFEGLMYISPLAKEELNWWVTNVMEVNNVIGSAPFSHVFQTDASNTGWGIACTTDRAQQTSGIWSQDQAALHINVRELYVVFICLKTFCKDRQDCHLKFELDNMTAVTYINQMGGSNSYDCDALARKIWAWCIPKNIWLSALHIPGTSNVLADSLSRRYSDHEWMLNKHYFSIICDIFPNLSIDLFASILNNQLPRYVSWKPDPNATYVDAFNISWEHEYFYAFPPFSLIHKCLEKIVVENAEGVLIVPVWASQTWYTRVLQLLVAQPRLMIWTSTRELLIHPLGKVHSMAGKLKLMVCPLSGDSTKNKAFQNTLPQFSLTHGVHLHANSTRSISRDGLYSVVRGRLIHIPPL